MSEVYEQWMVWREDGRGWYLVNDPETTFNSEEEAEAYCDEHNRARAGQAVIQERAAIVAYLQTNPDPIVRNWISAQIEAGEHLREQSK